MSPTSYQTAPPRGRVKHYTTGQLQASVRGGDVLQGLGKAIRILEPDDAQVRQFAALGIEEDGAGGAEQGEAAEQLAIVCVVLSDVRLQQQKLRQVLLYLLVGERVPPHLLAGDAPVCIEV